MKEKCIILWTVLTVCLALLVTVWPMAAHMAQIKEDARQVEELKKRTASLDEGQLEKYRDLAKWYNHQLKLGNQGLRGTYGSILDLGEGRMGVLEVPELGLRLAISHGLDGKVGHDPNTSFPIGGRGNHTVLMLTDAYAWSLGQTVYIDILGQRLAYRVESVQVMPKGWSTERPDAGGQEFLTLVLDRKDIRTIIRCIRCADLTVRPQDAPEPGLIILVAALPLLLVLPALEGRRRSAKCEHSPRICGFYREKPEKSNLF